MGIITQPAANKPVLSGTSASIKPYRDGLFAALVNEGAVPLPLVPEVPGEPEPEVPFEP